MALPHWDTSTIDDELFEPKWSQHATGITVDVVVQVHCYGCDMSLATTVPNGVSCRIMGTLPEMSGPGRFTLFGAVVASSEPLQLQLSPSTVVRAHRLPSVDSLLSLVEICSGLGGSSLGLEFAGFKLCAAVEWMPLLAELHTSVHPGVPVVVGDIGQSSTHQKLHEVCPTPFSLMAGVSCQPYSRAGRSGGSSDPRSNTVPATCRLCHLFQVPVLFIECVVPAKSNLFFRQHLSALGKLGYRILDCVLQLEQVWAAHRLRWWVVAGHPQLAIHELPNFPTSSPLVVRDLMPYIKEWPRDDLKQLQLTDAEEHEFLEHSRNNLRKFGLNMDTKLPTALHSWGNQVVSCACGCRDRLSAAFLTEKGLFAQLIPITPEQDGTQKWRHMHPMEVALLNGLPPLQRWSNNQRLNLCGIGQVASPLQAVWIGAQVLRQVQQALGISSPLDPSLCLHNMKHLVYQQCQSLFPTLPKPVSSAQCVVFWPESPNPVVIQVGSATTIGCLRKAEALLQQQDGTRWTFVDRDNKLPLLEDTRVAGLSLCVDPVVSVESLPHATISLSDSDLQMPEHHTPEVKPRDLIDSFEAAFDPDGDVTMAQVVETEPSLPQPVESIVPSVAPLTDALLQLKAKPLTCLQPPMVHDVSLCDLLLSQTMTVEDRLRILENQDVVWGDDEIRWHLGRLRDHCPSNGVTVLDPLLALGWARQPDILAVQQWLSKAPATQCIITCVLYHGHWTPVVWIDKVSHLEALLWDHSSVDLTVFEPLHKVICHSLKLPTFEVVASARSFAPEQYCGAAAIAFVEHQTCSQSLPRKESHLQAFNQECKNLFSNQVKALTVVCRPWCWGAGHFDVSGTLATLLTQHGVPVTAADSRAKLLVQSLGKSEVEKALQGVSPWKTLKILANQHTPIVQIVLPDELQQKEVSAKGKGKQRKSSGKGTMTKPVVRPADLDPSKLVLEPGTFCYGDDQPLSQLPLQQVGPLATGVAITTFQEAQTFLKAGQLLTHQSLALLILNSTSEPQTALQWSTVRFAA